MKVELRSKRKIEVYVDGEWQGTISLARPEDRVQVEIEHEGSLEVEAHIVTL